MAKSKPIVNIVSYGIYSKWNENSKELPQIQKFDLVVPARLDIEFGFIVNIKRAKNTQLHYCIDHPKIPDDDGIPMPPFTGSVYIKSNNWDFFLGDTVWAPTENKVGSWTLSLTLEDSVIAQKVFNVVEDHLWRE